MWSEQLFHFPNLLKTTVTKPVSSPGVFALFELPGEGGWGVWALEPGAIARPPPANSPDNLDR